MDIKLSFILPVYNVEAYLPRCADSILGQMTGECEMILVDDGTKDRSGQICDAYAARAPRVRVIHKENGGLSSARNAGMELAEGKYLCFIDSDDYIVENTVPSLLQWIGTESADICFLTTKKIYPDGTEAILEEALERESLHGAERSKALAHLAGRPTYPGSAWAKLWKREFLEKNQFRFPGDRRLSEDLIFCLNAYLAAESFDYLEFPFYCYRQSRPGSITSSITPRYYFDSFLFIEEAAKRFAEDQSSPEGKLALSAAAYEYVIRIWEAGMLEGQDREKAFQKLRQYRWVLSRGCTKKTGLVRAAAGFLGLKNTAVLLGIYQKHRS